METTSLINLTPILKVMLLGLTVACGPLAWWWLQHKSANNQGQRIKRLKALTAFTLFLTFDLVIFGAFTRLTDSGLGCPDWPGCYGSATPFGAKAHVDAAQAAIPTGAVTTTKAWIEMLHRYLATSVGVLILTLTLHSWWTRFTARKQAQTKVHQLSQYQLNTSLQISPRWPTASLIWVCVVGAFGALTVTLKLFPAIVTLHLLGALLLLALLTRQAKHYDLVTSETSTEAVPKRLRTALITTFVLVWLQIALGGWVSTNYAVLACDTFPVCQKSWWPQMDFANGFSLWRELGLTSLGENIPFSALTAIHYTHRLSAYVVFVALGYSAWLLSKAALSRPSPSFKRYSNWLIALALWQFFSGVTNAVMGWPLFAALAHTTGAAGLVMALTWILSKSDIGNTSNSSGTQAARKTSLSFKLQHRQ
jgi:cytochrome c oxidase assembly protein subunit 15